LQHVEPLRPGLFRFLLSDVLPDRFFILKRRRFPAGFTDTQAHRHEIALFPVMYPMTRATANLSGMLAHVGRIPLTHANAVEYD